MSETRARRPRGTATAIAVALLALTACTGSNGDNTTVAGTEHVCASCHGEHGRSVSPTFPDLAGQQKDYLVAQLTAFRDHKRADPHAQTYMWGMVARLSDATIDGLAAFYAAQRPAEGSSADPAELAGGGAIFAAGIPAQGVAPCQSCHGDKGQGAAAIPRLAGQHRSYLREQLEAFASKERTNAVMHDMSKSLTRQQIEQVAAYLASD